MLTTPTSQTQLIWHPRHPAHHLISPQSLFTIIYPLQNGPTLLSTDRRPFGMGLLHRPRLSTRSKVTHPLHSYPITLSHSPCAKTQRATPSIRQWPMARQFRPLATMARYMEKRIPRRHRWSDHESTWRRVVWRQALLAQHRVYRRPRDYSGNPHDRPRKLHQR